MRSALLLLALTAPALAQSELAAVKKEQGDARLKEGKSDEARAAYERAMEIDAGYLPAYDAAAPLWFAAADYAAAIRRLTVAVAKKPRYAMGWYNLGFAYRKTGEHRKAVDAYRAFIALRPKEPDPYFGLGMTYKAMGDTARAREAFASYVRLETHPEKQKFVGQAKRELESLDKPETADALNERGAAQFQEQQVEAAITSFEAAVKLDPKHKVAWYNLAHARRKAGRHPQAVEAYRAFIALDPQNPDPYYGLGHSLRATGDAAGAKEAFGRYVALEKRDSEKKWVERAKLALTELEKAPAGEPASQPAAPAPPTFRPAPPVDPREVAAHYKQGEALAKKGDLIGAIASFERALLLSPRHQAARRGVEIARARLAMAGKLPRPDKAKLLERARILTAEGRAATALAVLGPLTQEEDSPATGDAELLSVRAQARLGSGDAAGAILDWSAVLALDPRRPDAWRGLGDAHLAAGDRPRARWYYEGFLYRAGADPAAPAVRKQLGTL